MVEDFPLAEFPFQVSAQWLLYVPAFGVPPLGMWAIRGRTPS